MTLPLPVDFVRNIERSFPESSKTWLTALPALLKEAANRWGLALGEPFLLSYNYVCAAKMAGGADVVLKAGIPNPELTSEIEALGLYGGRGAVRLIDSDAERGLLLEERIQPGAMLLEVQDDDRATEIAAGVMRALWRPVPEPNRLVRLEDWFEGFKKLRRRFGGSGPIPPRLLETAEGLAAELLREEPVVLHGDLHHYNVLKAGGSWLAIDPKGVIGPCGYEAAPWMLNPSKDFLRGPEAARRARRRFAILSEQLGLERSRIRGWALAHALLSAWWDMDEQGSGGEYAIHCAQLFEQINI